MTPREKFIEILSEASHASQEIIKHWLETNDGRYFLTVTQSITAMQQAAEAQTEQLRPYLRHLNNCKYYDTHSANTVICTCGLDELLK